MLHGNLAVLLVVLAVIGYLSIGAYLSVMTSIRSLREGSERLAAGDLTAHIDTAARDELRYVAGSFNDMAGAMRALIGSIKSNSDHVADSARSGDRLGADSCGIPVPERCGIEHGRGGGADDGRHRERAMPARPTRWRIVPASCRAGRRDRRRSGRGDQPDRRLGE